MADDHGQHGTASLDQMKPTGHLSGEDGAHHVTGHATQGHDAHADSAHGHLPEMGRYISHPPEPPHLIRIWYKMEQKALQKEYAKEHGITDPHAFDHNAIEGWLEKDPVTGEWVEVKGEAPTMAQILHAGTLKEKMPLIGYAPWENHVFLVIALGVVVGGYWLLSAPFRGDRRMALRQPSRAQALMEMIVLAFDDFCKGILGEQNGRLYMPFIATLFSVILVGNLMGLVPLMKAPTSSIMITFSLAMCTFLVVQGTAWGRLGPATYLHHLMGSPKDAIGWVLSPLFLVLEVISDFLAKPFSLALRLMGNIMGKDILLGVFLGLGISSMTLVAGPLSNYIGLPLTIPFYFLGLLLSTIQALVFSLLTCIYISMVLPHDHDHDHDHHDDHGHDHGHGHEMSMIEHVPAASSQPNVVHERVPH